MERSPLTEFALNFPLSRQEIADLVGSSRVTVTQILNQFRTSHWIEIESKRVTIHNLDALEDMVGFTGSSSSPSTRQSGRF